MPSFPLPALRDAVSHENNILAYDHGWQYPAVTEQHAFHKVRELAQIPDGVTYVAYPWATLIDKVQWAAKDATIHLDRFREFCKRLPRDTIKITVCQHISMRRHLHLFEQAGISHIFWTHAEKSDSGRQARTASPRSTHSRSTPCRFPNFWRARASMPTVRSGRICSRSSARARNSIT